jgi:hypothetical protein
MHLPDPNQIDALTVDATSNIIAAASKPGKGPSSLLPRKHLPRQEEHVGAPRLPR